METDVFAFTKFNKGPGTSTRSEAGLGHIRPWPGISTRSEAALGAQPGPVAKKESLTARDSGFFLDERFFSESHGATQCMFRN